MDKIEISKDQDATEQLEFNEKNYTTLLGKYQQLKTTVQTLYDEKKEMKTKHETELADTRNTYGKHILVLGEEHLNEKRKMKEQEQKRMQLETQSRIDLSIKADRWFTVTIVLFALICF